MKRLPHKPGCHILDAVRLGNRLAQPNHTLQLPHRNAITVTPDAPLRVIRPEFFVLLDQQRPRLGRELRLECPRKPDVALQLLGRELGCDGVVAQPVDVDNVFGEVPVDALVAFVEDDEEEVEAAHDWRAHVDVGPQRCFAVVAPADRVGGREDAGSSVERGLDAGFGDGDGLLFHGFVDGDLVGDVHFVEFVNGTDAIVGEHEGAGFDGEFARFFVFDDGGGETGG